MCELAFTVKRLQRHEIESDPRPGFWVHAGDYNTVLRQRDEGLAREAELRDELERCESMATMIQDREWAEHAGKGDVSARVESSFTQMHNELSALQQRLAEAEKAAARYRFLRDGDRGGIEYWDDELCVCEPEDTLFGKALDARVDRSIAVLAERVASPGCADGEKVECGACPGCPETCRHEAENPPA